MTTRSLIRLVLLFCMAFSGGMAMGAEPNKAIVVDIQYTHPTDIVSAQARISGGKIAVSGLVRHVGPPGRNAIYGHVVAEYGAAGSSDLTRIDVPLQAHPKPTPNRREARFTVDIPRAGGTPMIVHLRYVEERI